MKKCTYCGKVTSDDATECPIDRHSLVGYTPPPQAEQHCESKPTIERRPIFSVLAILTPFGGLLFMQVSVFCFLLVTPIIGIAFVVIAFLRHERYLALRLIGLFFIAVMVLLLLVLLCLMSGMGHGC